MRNHGNYIISLGNVCRWLAQRAEALGVEIYPGFAGAGLLYDDAGNVAGVATGAQGIGKDGQPTANFQAGVDLAAKVTLIAEGCRGSLAKGLAARFDLRRESGPQTYGLGLKELWEVDAAQHRPGLVVHTVGWPLELAHLWRLVSLPPREPAGGGGVRRRPRLRKSVSQPVRGISALQDPSGDPPARSPAGVASPMVRAP